MTRGFTLVESLVATALFLVVGLLLFALFRYSLDSYARGQMTTDVEHGLRDISSRMTADMQTGMVLQIGTNLSTTSAVKSAVLLPTTESNFSVDDFICTVPATSNINTVNTSDPNSYMLLRYAVHNHDPSNPSDPPTAVYRRTYNFSEVYSNYISYGVPSSTSLNPSGNPTGNPQNTGLAQWFVVQPALDTQYGGPANNTQVGTGTNDTPWTPVFTLVGQYDLATFMVSHAALQANAGSSYDPYHYILNVTLERYDGTPVTVVTYIGNPADGANNHVINSVESEITLQRFQ